MLLRALESISQPITPMPRSVMAQVAIDSIGAVDLKAPKVWAAEAELQTHSCLWAVQARQALELIAAPQRNDGTWNRDREACRALAAQALDRCDALMGDQDDAAK